MTAAGSPATLPLADSTPIERHAGPFWPVFVWAVAQFGVLALAACRVPLSARWPVPAEKLALHEMAIGQLLVAALLLPFLFRTFTATAMVLVLAPLFLLIAAAVAAFADTPRLVACAAYVGLWLVTFAIAGAAARGPRAKLYVAAAAGMLAAGGAVLAYVRREFALPAQTFEWSQVSAAGPVSGVVALLEDGPRIGTIWVELGSALGLALLAWAATRFFARRRAKTA